MSERPDDEDDFIVDCDILEKAKENIQPLAGGRSATALAAVLKTPHAHKDTRLAGTRARLRKCVREAQELVERASSLQGDGDDATDDELTVEEAEEVLLSAYVQLVTWTVEHYPRGQSVESGILELLEEATRVMRHSPFAKADPRYLNLWLRYATYVEHPEVIFEFLLANDIGTAWAKLYEEYALVLERSKRRTKADEIYLLGINRKAELLDHLQRRHKDFQKRMMVAAPASEPEHESPAGLASAAPASAIPRRKILGDSASFSSTSSIPSSTSGSQRNGLAAAASREDVFAASSASSSTRPNGRMQIFADPSGTEAEAASRSAWPELRTRKERVKENVRAPEKMQGAVLKQRGAAKAATKQAGARARAAPKIVPFRDPEPSAAASSSKIVPFRDPEPSGASRSTLADSKGIAKKSAGKAGIVPFVDDAKDVEKSVNTKPSAPPPTKFVPFKDPTSEQSPVTSASALPVPDSVMRPKALGSDGISGAISEAEALRKDPFKNYKDD